MVRDLRGTDGAWQTGIREPRALQSPFSKVSFLTVIGGSGRMADALGKFCGDHSCNQQDADEAVWAASRPWYLWRCLRTGMSKRGGI